MNLLNNFYRTITRNRQLYLLNMMGLIPGLACCLLILLWIRYEYNVDRQYPEATKIVTVAGYHEGSNAFGGAPPIVGPTLAAENPEVVDFARIAWGNRSLRYENETYNITSFDVDPGYFSIFGVEMRDGKSFGAEELNKCVISESAAREVFGDKDAVGQMLSFDSGNFEVAGVMKDPDKNSTVLASSGELSRPGVCVLLPILRNKESLQHWYNNSYRTYLRMNEEPDMALFKEKVKNRVMEVHPEFALYLTSDLLVNRNLYTYGNIQRMRLMGIIALAVLLIACINFINLATAGFTKSSFQTGLRKILGASRTGLIGQYLLNTFLVILISFVLAIGLAMLMFPIFNSMLGKSLDMKDLFSLNQIWLGLGVVVLTALLAGIYPAIYLSSFKPLNLLKGNLSKGSWNARFRQVLVVIQFCVSIVLIISTLVITRQIQLFQTMNLGYEWQEVMYLSLRNENQQAKGKVLKEELLKDATVKHVSLSVSVPTNINWNGVGIECDENKEMSKLLVSFNFADEDWASVYDLKFREGAFYSDSTKGVVINEKMLELMNTQAALDKELRRDGNSFKIVGVLDKFKFNNFKTASEPCLILPFEEGVPPNIVNIRVSGNDLQQIFERVNKRAEEILGEKPTLRFLDHNIELKLIAERQSSQMVTYFSVLAILISCLGLFGLAAFMIEQKRKEIGIRRVNGARIREIIWLLNMSFIKPVLVGFVIACPVAWYIMNKWLENYMEKTTLDLWIFAGAGFITIVIATLTLVWRTWSAATENPVNCLKEE
ncbi:MAG: ABC transporter permease [Bacteroidales bacterium]